MIEKIVRKLLLKYYKRLLEKKVGKRLPTVIVKGKIYFENGTIEIGDNVILYPNITFSGNGTIKIGNNCKIGQDTIIYANKNGGIEIGNDTIIAAQTYIIDSNHGIELGKTISSQPLSSSKVVIGNDVWIGANSTILKGAKCGDGCVIGAKALVNKAIPDNAIAVGSPIRILKYRNNGE